jgi:hypothetical protein
LAKWVSKIEEEKNTSLSTRVDILHHAKIFYEVIILYSNHGLGENFFCLLICGYVPELHNSSLHHVSNVMVFDIYII